MTDRVSVSRHVLAAILVLALALIGFGRGLAAASATDPGRGLANASVPICHSGAGHGSVPAAPLDHDCCDACALLAAAVVPPVVLVSGPAPAVHAVQHAGAMRRLPDPIRHRTPRQSQGPPQA